jgi:hypothetical protein
LRLPWGGKERERHLQTIADLGCNGELDPPYGETSTGDLSGIVQVGRISLQGSEYDSISRSMAFLACMKGRDGATELITPSFEHRNPMDMLVFQTILDLATEGGIRVRRRPVFVKELLEAARENRLLEAFGVAEDGTVLPISTIIHGGKEHKFPLEPTDNGNGNLGPIASKLFDELMSIAYASKPQYLEQQHPWTSLV